MISQARKSSYSIKREDIPLTDKEIIQRYIGIDKFPCKISSPLRDDDNRPSFSLIERDGIIIWKDFGSGDSGNAISLLKKLWHVDYSEALLKIQLDTNNRISHFDLIRKYKGQLHVVHSSTIKVKIRAWQAWDKAYWQSFGIPTSFAERCCVYPISHAFFTREIDGKLRTTTIPMDKYAYAYFEWKDNKESIKLYQPFSKNLKWLSKHDLSVWDLWKQAFLYAEQTSNESVIITSSRKDAMCLWYTLKIPSMSLQGEGYIPKPHVMQQVLERFKRVYLWYDNDYSHTKDNPGQDNAKKLITLYPTLQNICIPTGYKCKDPSDFIKEYGITKLIKLWNILK